MQQYGYNNYGGRGFNSSSAWNGNYSRNYDDWNDNYAGGKGKGKGGKGFQFHSSPTYSQASLYQQQRGLLQKIGDYSACTTCNAPDHFSSQCTIASSREFWQVCKHTITKVKSAIEYERRNPSPMTDTFDRVVRKDDRRYPLLIGGVDPYTPLSVCEKIRNKLGAMNHIVPFCFDKSRLILGCFLLFYNSKKERKHAYKVASRGIRIQGDPVVPSLPTKECIKIILKGKRNPYGAGWRVIVGHSDSEPSDSGEESDDSSCSDSSDTPLRKTKKEKGKAPATDVQAATTSQNIASSSSDAQVSMPMELDKPEVKKVGDYVSHLMTHLRGDVDQKIDKQSERIDNLSKDVQQTRQELRLVGDRLDQVSTAIPQQLEAHGASLAESITNRIQLMFAENTRCPATQSPIHDPVREWHTRQGSDLMSYQGHSSHTEIIELDSPDVALTAILSEPSSRREYTPSEPAPVKTEAELKREGDCVCISDDESKNGVQTRVPRVAATQAKARLRNFGNRSKNKSKAIKARARPY